MTQICVMTVISVGCAHADGCRDHVRRPHGAVLRAAVRVPADGRAPHRVPGGLRSAAADHRRAGRRAAGQPQRDHGRDQDSRGDEARPPVAGGRRADGPDRGRTPLAAGNGHGDRRVRGAPGPRSRGAGDPGRGAGAAPRSAAGDGGVQHVPAGGDPAHARWLARAPGRARRRREAARGRVVGVSALAIEVKGARKAFGETVVLDGVDLAVAPGSVVALLGPNGAGKTTIVRILSTLIGADAGELRVAGHDVRTDPDAVRTAIGVTGQFSAVDDLLTGAENLRLIADLKHLGRQAGARRVQQLLERFDLLDAADRAAATYSGGMRRRLDLAMTLVGAPRVIFLDEPTTGLDPRSRRTMWEAIRELVAEGVTIFLTTQYLDEADHL